MIISQDNITQEERDQVREKTEHAYQKIFGHDHAVAAMTVWEAYHLLALQFDFLLRAIQMLAQNQLKDAYNAGLTDGIQRAVTHGGNGVRGIVKP